MGLLPEAKCRSEAFCSNIKLKNASIFAIISLRSMGLVAKSAPLCKPLSKLAEIIAKEIAEGGIIPFARFMELALYCPEYGFYEKERDRIGRRGDYFTSVSVGEVFGRLLAFQFAAWAEKQKTEHKSTEIDSRIRLVEGGGHD